MKTIKIKSVMFIGLMLCMLLPYAASAQGDSSSNKAIVAKPLPVSLAFDGQKLELPSGQYVFEYQSRTYVPVRFVSYALQKTVKWNSETATVTVAEPTAEEAAALKEQLAGAIAVEEDAAAATASIRLTEVQASFVFEGKEQALPANQSAFYYKGSIYVPIRFMAEASGAAIKWDSKTGAVTGETAAYQQEQAEAGGSGGSGQGSAGSGGTQPGTGGASQPGTGGGSQPGTGGSGQPGTGGGAVDNTPKVAYEVITSEAEGKLDTLKTEATSTLTNLYMSFVAARDEATKEQLKLQAQTEVARTKSDFEAILADTAAKLTANGHSTAVIAEYRTAFEKDLATVLSYAESLA
ncbi:copper amine oxidase N-terminal domain-containing protein [Paenibacillus algorifonticola]|uniref:copper amine oxidase N-terminal domain-containing protein n=1 Tax=Paenibacillus algorifonticola TaxID=684063 RepID=UPI003D275FCF